MKKVVKTHLSNENIPLEWAVTGAGECLYTAHVPFREDGTVETGDIEAQTKVTLDNLKRTVEAAGGTLNDVTQVIVYLPNKADYAGMNKVYSQYFQKPFPNRATVCAELFVPGARIEIVAYAHI